MFFLISLLKFLWVQLLKVLTLDLKVTHVNSGSNTRDWAHPLHRLSLLIGNCQPSAINTTCCQKPPLLKIASSIPNAFLFSTHVPSIHDDWSRERAGGQNKGPSVGQSSGCSSTYRGSGLRTNSPARGQWGGHVALGRRPLLGEGSRRWWPQRGRGKHQWSITGSTCK